MLQSLRPALLSIRELCNRISDMRLCRIESQRTYTLEEFQAAQRTQLAEVRHHTHSTRMQYASEQRSDINMINDLLLHAIFFILPC